MVQTVRHVGKLALLLAFLTAMVGVGFSLFVAWKFQSAEMAAITREFRKDVDVQATDLDLRLNLNLEGVYTFKTLFDNSDHVTADEFSQAARATIARHRDIEAMHWVPYLPDADRPAYVTAKRQRNPDFRVSEHSKEGGLVAAARRSEYFPLEYLEAAGGNHETAGFDLGTKPVLLETLLSARDSGSLSITAGLPAGGNHPPGRLFLAVQPVYHARVHNIEERRAELRGFVIASSRIENIFGSSLLPTTGTGINMTLLDDADHGGGILYNHQLSPPSSQTARFSYRRLLSKVAGHHWSIIATPTPGYLAERQSMLPVIIFLAGTALICLATIFILGLLRHSHIVEKMVDMRTQELNIANAQLERLSRIDGLTGVANRRVFDEHLSQEWRRATRAGKALAVILLDIDHFKPYNDFYGHLEGDTCLKKVARCLQDTLKRPGDLVARYGGEEFALVLPHTDDHGASLAESLRASVEKLQVPHHRSTTADVVTISAGFASLVPDDDNSPAILVAEADRALYRAKEKGRNRVEAAPHLPKANSSAHLSA